MEYYEARSIKEIKLLLKQKGYRSKSKVRDHISFLEDLADKINRRIKDEIEVGEVAWKEKEDLKKIHEVFQALCTELNQMELAKMDQPPSKYKGLF
ncbi:hypothetical protein KY328_04445 [Candidatus Woesearchaeota archaeon]|nr:hypothetical protein [Candidatus Woesearchaeota archaeon]MBW3022149.1 hypothetical protein [Candidatus Woesearchaeota archaeon]